MKIVYLMACHVPSTNDVYVCYYESEELAKLDKELSGELSGTISPRCILGLPEATLTTLYDILHNVDTDDRKLVEKAMDYVITNLPDQVEYFKKVWDY